MIRFEAETHSYYLGGVKVPSVTEIMARGGMFNFANVDEGVMERAKSFGSAIHLACQFSDLNCLDENLLDNNLLPYLNAWKKFKKDFKLEFEGENIERVVYSKRLQYAGTEDRKVKVSGKWWLLDIKSSATLAPSTGVQLAGYQIAEEEMSGDRIKHCVGVQLKPNGWYSVKTYDKPNHREKFLSLLSIKEGVKI